MEEIPLLHNSKNQKWIWRFFFLLSFLFVFYILIAFILEPIKEWGIFSRMPYPEKSLPMQIHWVGGILVILLGGFQMKYNHTISKTHHWRGIIYIIGCYLAVYGGMYYIFHHGSSGGKLMDIAFLIYGMLLAIFATAAWYFAVKRNFLLHQCFSTLTFTMGVGSLLYRVYTLPLLVFNSHFSESQIRIWMITSSWLMFIPNIIITILYLWYKHRNQTFIHINDNEYYRIL